MSIKLMSAIFEAEFHDLEYVKDNETRKAKASTCKLVLLAIADHANDEGGAYPGYSRLETKTALSRQGLADTIDALKYNGILIVDEKRSRLNTNDYTINIRSFPAISKELPDIIQQESSHLTSVSQATLPKVVKPLDLNHHLTINQPSSEKNKKIINSAFDTVNAIIGLELDSKGKDKKAIQDRFEVALRINPNWDSIIWRDFDSWLISQERKGRTIEDWAAWWKSDDFRRDKQITNLNPSKIKQNWNLAFDDGTKVTQDNGGMYV